MIRSVEITNFKSIRHQKIDLERLTVFVGANASGKTSVLEAIAWAAEISTLWDRVGKEINPPLPASISNQIQTELKPQWYCDLVCNSKSDIISTIVISNSDREFLVNAEPPDDDGPRRAEPLGRRDWSIFVEPGTGVDNEAVRMPSLGEIQFQTSHLARPSYSDRTPPCLGPEGEDLSSVVAYMALNDPDNFRALVDELKGLIPHLERIRFTKSPVTRIETEVVRLGDETVERHLKRTYQGDALLFDFENTKGIPARAVSEGTLMLLGLLTKLLGPERPEVLLIDNIDRGLHPIAQRELIKVLRKLMERFPNLQILATTHSPYLLDSVEPEEVRMMALDEDGASVCGRLTDHPRFEKWKNGMDMTPGELWSLLGEQWVANPEKAATS